MELGLRANIDQFKDNNTVQMQQIKESNLSAKADEKKDLQEIQKQENKQVDEKNRVNEVKNEQKKENAFEVVISNTNFGFNLNSRDFFVKVARGNVENQYPTEEMMKTKARLLAFNKESIKSIEN
ncbi:hypothetical protein [Arcobacter porcinus]|uniref:FlaG family protein n=1 Tax=Arcobacter porcinus TaxID=1935204 RepID=A0ABX2YAS2_9BACT|nr:hypothetical protein [Arcobacter porcinus]OCL81980.1 hypothetical protein AAW29_01689 [Arcobacter porcinus]OCL82056.1 hypothetical protein AAW30_01693 [Arcobacter porcinus]OCL86173.1 hypothetical protein AAX30_01516 [Arcobacter porcinus]OCL90312.1 hypothetical protein AAX28_01798 [Arcobacter porcinus]